MGMSLDASDADLLTHLSRLFGPGNIFTKVDVHDASIHVSSTPLRDAEARLEALHEVWIPKQHRTGAFPTLDGHESGVFSFPIFGRSFLVARYSDVWRFLFSASRTHLHPKLFDVHEHYGLNGRGFVFFMDLDSKDPNLALLSDDELMREMQSLHDVVGGLAEMHDWNRISAPLVYRSTYAQTPKLSLHAVFPLVCVPDAATAMGFAKRVEEAWVSPLTRCFDKCFRLRGSLRMPWAAKWKTPTAIKHPIPSSRRAASEDFVAGLLYPCVAPCIQRIHDVREVHAFRDVPDWRPILPDLAVFVCPDLFLDPHYVPQVINVRMEIKPSIFKPSLLPSRVFIHFRPGSTPCPTARRIHRRAPLTCILSPGGMAFSCMHGGICSGTRPFMLRDEAGNQRGTKFLSNMLSFFFGKSIALDEISKRHVAFPMGRYVSYLSRLQHRDVIGSSFLSLYRTPLNLAYSNRFYFDGVQPASQAGLLDDVEIQDQRLATTTFFEPICIKESLAHTDRPFELKGGRVNIFEAPPLVDAPPNARNGIFLRDAFLALFSPAESHALFSYLAYVVRHGRPAVALCLVGPEGCGKSTIFKVLLSWFAPHIVTFNQETHIQEDKFNSALMEKTIVLFDDCEKLVRNFIYDLITTSTPHGVRRMHQEWSAAQLYTTVFVAFNPAKNPIPLEFGHQRRFLVLEVRTDAHLEPNFWPHFLEAAEKGGSRAFIENELLTRPDDFTFGEAVQTPTYLRERAIANPFAVFVGDTLVSRRFPLARGAGRPTDGVSRYLEMRINDVETSFLIGKRPGTWWLGFKYLFDEMHGASTDAKALTAFLTHVFKPEFTESSCQIAPWRECVRRFQADFAHEQLDKAFPKP